MIKIANHISIFFFKIPVAIQKGYERDIKPVMEEVLR